MVTQRAFNASMLDDIRTAADMTPDVAEVIPSLEDVSSDEETIERLTSGKSKGKPAKKEKKSKKSNAREAVSDDEPAPVQDEE